MNWTQLVHLIIGAMGIGAFCALGAIGTINGEAAVTGIGGITGALLGASAVLATVSTNVAKSSTTTPTTTESVVQRGN